MIYCDTSLLVQALTWENATDLAQNWLRKQADGSLCISGWVDTEFSSALAIKLRHGVVTLPERAAVLTNWRSMIVQSLTVIDVAPGAFELAARFIDRPDVNLRSGDALHLAIASLSGHTLATLDRAMAEAAVAVGVGVVPV